MRSLWNRGRELLLSGQEEEFWSYVKKLRRGNRTQRSVSLSLEEYYWTVKTDPVKTVKFGRKLVSSTTHPALLHLAYSHMSWAFRVMGDIRSSELAAKRSLEISKGTEKYASAMIDMAYYYFFVEEIDRAKEYLPDTAELNTSDTNLLSLFCLRSNMELFQGRPLEAESWARRFFTLRFKAGTIKAGVGFESLGMSLEAQGRFEEAAQAYEAGLNDFIEQASPYALPLLNKLNRTILFGSLDQKIDKKIQAQALALAKGAQESKPWLLEKRAITEWAKLRFDRAVRFLIEAGDAYISINQPQEHFYLHFLAAMLAKQHDTAGFWSAFERIKSRFSLYKNYLENHHCFRDFAGFLAPLLSAKQKKTKPHIRIRMFGGLELQGLKEAKHWRSKKALYFFKYLLINEGKPLQADYLVFLLWPRANPESGLNRLYTAASTMRSELGEFKDLLISRARSYVIEETQELEIDVHMFSRLLQEANLLSENPVLQLEKLLAALRLYRGKLLPEDRYDRFIEEHRNYFHSQFQTALSKAVEIMVQSRQQNRAIELCKRFYAMFPDDETLVETYINLLINTGQFRKAESLYRDFEKILWREHRRKPHFTLTRKRL